MTLVLCGETHNFPLAFLTDPIHPAPHNARCIAAVLVYPQGVRARKSIPERVYRLCVVEYHYNQGVASKCLFS